MHEKIVFEHEHLEKREREREKSNSKTSILKDCSVRSIWTYLTASSCYIRERERESRGGREREREIRGGREREREERGGERI